MSKADICNLLETVATPNQDGMQGFANISMRFQNLIGHRRMAASQLIIDELRSIWDCFNGSPVDDDLGCQFCELRNL
jgi:hypothetical protein